MTILVRRPNLVVPVDEWAIVVLAAAKACAARDAEKQAASRRLQASA